MTDEAAWEVASAQLEQLIGSVTISMAYIEDSVDEIVLDLLTHPALFVFFKRRVLGGWMLGRKIELLTAYANDHDFVADAPGALEVLRDVKAAAELRNRLVHDVHAVSDDGQEVTRRRLWEEDGQPVDLTAYEELSERLKELSGWQMERLSYALQLPAPGT